jgi:hypothetical protein
VSFRFDLFVYLVRLGDVALPGLLVSYLLRFDYTHGVYGTKQAYFPPVVLGYALGLMCTDVALVVMQAGQPALLYIVPLTLGPTLALAWKRNHWQAMWSGSQPSQPGPNVQLQQMQDPGTQTLLTQENYASEV